MASIKHNSFRCSNREESLKQADNMLPGYWLRQVSRVKRAANSTDAIDMPGTGSTAIPTDAYVKFDFGVGVKKYIDEVRLRFSTGANMKNLLNLSLKNPLT